MQELSQQELTQLVRSVFPPLSGDKGLAVLVDIPNQPNEDNDPWQKRRSIAQDWAKKLQSACPELGLEKAILIAYPSVGSNNADLPPTVYISDSLPQLSSDLEKLGKAVALEEIFSMAQIFLAPTEFSTTAPLKVIARKYPIRGATMPGFCPAMIPSLRLDYQEIGRRVDILKMKLDLAQLCKIIFLVDGHEYRLQLDLNFRHGHASAGRFPTAGMVGNLPSGEAYIVPYEGEKGTSKSFGQLPVQFGDEVVVYEIQNNRAISISSQGEMSQKERITMQSEPAYCNLAELGLGVLCDFGIQPIGEILLDEKLGLHIAFGRSDHFGGIVGPLQFSSAQAVVHIDRIYIPELQPKVEIPLVIFVYPDGQEEIILRDGKYANIFSIQI